MFRGEVVGVEKRRQGFEKDGISKEDTSVVNIFWRTRIILWYYYCYFALFLCAGYCNSRKVYKEMFTRKIE